MQARDPTVTWKVSKILEAHRSGTDVADSVVAEATKGTHSSCAEVAVAGKCDHEAAQVGCPETCGAAVHELSVTQENFKCWINGVGPGKGCCLGQCDALTRHCC